MTLENLQHYECTCTCGHEPSFYLFELIDFAVFRGMALDDAKPRQGGKLK